MRSTSADSPQVVDLGYASYQGILNSTTDITSFLGLRYAHPPSGNLRFQAPQDPSIVSDVQSATNLGRVCPQGAQGLAASSPFNRLTTNDEIEDCLFANVYIHGGGYVSGAITVTDGGDLIRACDRSVVVVEIAYRLGIFGFLLVRRICIEMVQNHISSFGEDPARVTIRGESAGAGSVLQYITAHGGNTEPPLFHAAMTSSTLLPSQYNYDDAVPEQLHSQSLRKQVVPTPVIHSLASSTPMQPCLKPQTLRSARSPLIHPLSSLSSTGSSSSIGQQRLSAKADSMDLLYPSPIHLKG
ncbi:hypothetical protein ACEPAI_3799 [Sanghuangporus weigelae]